MIQGQVAKDSGLYLYFLCVHFPFHLVAGFQFDTAENTRTAKHFYRFARQVGIEYLRRAGFAVKAATFGLFHPFFAVSVAVEVYRLTLYYQLAHLAQYCLA